MTKDMTTTSRFPTTQVIVSGFAAGFIAFVISLVAFMALTDDTMSEAVRTGLFIGSATTMVTIIVQLGIHMSRGRR